MPPFARHLPGPVLAVGLLLISAAALGAQDRPRRLTGRVVEHATLQPVVGAQILVDGVFAAVANDSGRFVVRTEAVDVTLTARGIGYAPLSRRVSPDETDILIELRRDVFKLDGVVVTGHATGVARRHAPTSTAVVEATDLSRTSTSTIEHALQGKIAGAQISQRTGAPGGGSWVRIRGSSTVMGESNPLYVVDGVIVADDRISNGQNYITRAGGGAIAAASQDSPVNRIADLNPNEIERVEVLRGPSAAAIYGSKASNGVVIITTKQGRTGAPRLTVTTGAGTSRLAARYGHRRFLSAAAADSAFSGSGALFDSTTNIDYESLAYGERPAHSEHSLSLSGGNAATRYFLSAGQRHEGGIVARTYATKRSVRVNLQQRLSERVDLGVNVSATGSRYDRGLFGNDNNGSSVGFALPSVPSFVDIRRRPDGTWPKLPWLNSNPLQTIALVENEENVSRGIVSARIDWRVAEFGRQTLSFAAVGGTDLSMQRNEIYSPPELFFEPLDGNPGTASASENRTTLGNLNLNLVHRWQTDRSTLTTQVGTQYEQYGFGELRVASQNLFGGLETAAAGAVLVANDFRGETRDLGIFAQSEWLWRDRLLVTLGGRADRSSNNGDVDRFYLYPKASLSYTLDAPVPAVVDEVKFRVAYGATGNRPWYGLKFGTLALGVVGGQTSLAPSATRTSPDVRPEHQEEIEAGFDAVLLARRFLLDVTAFRREVSGMLIPLGAAPSSGYLSETGNGADMKSWGLETALTAVPFSSASTEWTSRVTFGFNRSEITRLDAPGFRLGSSQLAGQALIFVGRSPTSIGGTDTLPFPGRYPVPVELGDGNPEWTGAWSNEVRWRRFTAFALIDHQEGGLLNTGTWRLYINARNTFDHSRTTSTGATLGEERRQAAGVVSRVFYRDATYTKLRELTLGVDLPPAVLDVFLRARSGTLRLSGRNLIWWSGLRGVDPESENFGGGGVAAALQRNRELGAYPASRSYWLTLTLVY